MLLAPHAGHNAFVRAGRSRSDVVAPRGVVTAGLAVAFGGLAVLGITGNSARVDLWRLGTLAFAALAAAAVVRSEHVAVRRSEATMAVALLGLAGWSALSTSWSLHPEASAADAERLLFYAAALAAVFFGVERRGLRPVVIAVVAAITVVTAVGIGERYLESGPRNPTQGLLLIQPFGYANALAIYVAMGALLALGLALDARSRSERAAALSPFVVFLPALALTSSRGGWAALGLGVVTLLVVAGRLRSRKLVVVCIIAALATGVAIGSTRRQFTPVDRYRVHYWHVAWQEVEAHPVLGGGGGTFGDYFWRYHRPPSAFAREAHDAYLQTLAELGPLGLALLVVGLVQPLGALRMRHRPLVAGALGAYVAFLAHMVIDWEWIIAPVAVVGLACGALALVGTRPPVG
jgi:O-antigen ligase